MASSPVEGGLVIVADVLDEAIGVVDGDVAALVAPMRWNNNTSRFVLRRMAQFLSDGTRPDKVFKDKDVNFVA